MSIINHFATKKRGIIIANAIFIIVICVISLGFVNETQKNSKQEITNIIQSVLNQTHRTYDVWLDMQSQNAQLLSKNIQVSQLVNAVILKNEPTNYKKLTGLLSSLSLQTGVDRFQIIDINDRVILDSVEKNSFPSLIKQYYPNRHAQVLSGISVIIPPLLTPTDIKSTDPFILYKRNEIKFLAPIFNKEQAVIAILSISQVIDNELSTLISAGRLGSTGETYLLSDQGIMLSKSRHRKALIDQGLFPNSLGSYGFIELIKPALSSQSEGDLVSSDTKYTEMAQGIMHKKSGNNVIGYTDYRGEEVYGAWLWDEHSGLGLTTEIDKKEAHYTFNRMAFISKVLVTIIIVSAILMSVFVIYLQSVRERFFTKTRRNLERVVEEKTKSLEVALATMEKQATTDMLTAIANRRHFDNNYNNAWSLCLREKLSIGIVLLDVDFFKSYNDNYGHRAGDECLRKVAEVLSSVQFGNRPFDLLARYGGEEFVIVLANTHADYVLDVAEQIRIAIDEANILHEYRLDDIDHITVSVGCSCIVPDETMTNYSLVEQADEMLYRAKSCGRNITKVYSSPKVTKPVLISSTQLNS